MLVLLALLLAQPAAPPLRLRDEGITKGWVDTLNFTGAGATCSATGRIGTCVITGGGGTGTPGGVSGNIQVNDGAGAFGAYTGTSCAYAVKTLNASGAATCTAAPSIPADLSAEPFITQTASANLSNEFALSSLTTGILLNTTATGVPTVYAGTSCSANQYMTALDTSGVKTCSQVAYSQLTGAPTIPADISGASFITKVAEASLSNEFALGTLANGLLKNTTTTGVPVIYGGTSCTNQFPRSLDASGAATCASVAAATDVTGILPLANGGTSANLTAANGQVAYSTAGALALTTGGATGNILSFNSGAAPTWIGGPKTLRVSSSNFTTTSVTASTVTGLSWSGAASTVYYFHCALAATGSATGAPRLLTNYSGTTSAFAASITNHTTSATTLLYTGQVAATGTLTASCTASCLTTQIPFVVQGLFTATGSGTFAIQAANSTAGQTTTVMIGSSCVYWIVP